MIYKSEKNLYLQIQSIYLVHEVVYLQPAALEGCWEFLFEIGSISSWTSALAISDKDCILTLVDIIMP